MKILFVCENYLPHVGGAEVVFKNLAEGFIREGHTVNLVTHRMRGTKRFEIIGGVRVHRVWSAGSRYLFSLTAIPKVWSLARKCEIIQTTTFNGAPPAWFCAKICGKKVVLTVHEVWIGKWNRVTSLSPLSCFIHNLLERMIYLLKFDKYICVSDATKRDILNLNINPSKVERIYNGFNYEYWTKTKFQGSSIRKKWNLKSKFVYFSWGRPGSSKGFEYAIQAVPLIIQKIPNSHYLLMLGSKEKYQKEYNSLVRLITSLNIKDHITIVPSVPYSELGNYLAAANCVVVPSLSEGFGYAAVEAGVMGKPIVASNIASLPEVVSGKFILTKPKDPLAIAIGVEMIKKKKYKKSPQKTFSWKSALDSYLVIYNQLIRKSN